MTRVLSLTLLALLLASPVLAQKSTTHNAAVTVGDTTYLINTWISGDGRRSTSSVNSVTFGDCWYTCLARLKAEQDQWVRDHTPRPALEWNPVTKTIETADGRLWDDDGLSVDMRAEAAAAARRPKADGPPPPTSEVDRKAEAAAARRLQAQH